MSVYLPRPTPLHAHPALREAAKPRYFPWLRDYPALHNVGVARGGGARGVAMAQAGVRCIE